MTEKNKYLKAFEEQLNNPNAFRAIDMLQNSIARGTQHFDREHTKELFDTCVCGKTIDPDCQLHKNFLGDSV